jgi:hypothetical protein
MSDTPETDTEGYGDGRHPWVATEFARKLERERDEARRESLEQTRLLVISGEWGCKLIADRDEIRAITKEAITGLYNLGDYDLANKLSSKLEGPK